VPVRVPAALKEEKPPPLPAKPESTEVALREPPVNSYCPSNAALAGVINAAKATIKPKILTIS
jgi:hypothetical protein